MTYYERCLWYYKHNERYLSPNFEKRNHNCPNIVEVILCDNIASFAYKFHQRLGVIHELHWHEPGDFATIRVPRHPWICISPLRSGGSSWFSTCQWLKAYRIIKTPVGMSRELSTSLINAISLTFSVGNWTMLKNRRDQMKFRQPWELAQIVFDHHRAQDLKK